MSSLVNVKQKTESGLATDIQYDIGNLPRRMSRNGITSDFFEAPGGRYWQRLVSGGSTRDTLMLEKTYERELLGGAVTVERYYLAGQLLTIKPSQVRKLSYLHQDRLGSNVAISEKALTGAGGLDGTAPALVEVRGFDAFGKALDGEWGTSNNGLLNVFDVKSVFHVGQRNQRGFTGHEHLDEFQLIHMNGRAYDFNVGRFYGVDPFIQFPSNSQSLNPYGYLMNNPLSGTDPTGYTACTDVSAKTSGTGTCEHNGATVSYSGEGDDLKLSGGAASEFVSTANNAMGTTGDIRVSFNGASNRQGVTQVSQTDGSNRGSANIGESKTNSMSKPNTADGDPQGIELTRTRKLTNDPTTTSRGMGFLRQPSGISDKVIPNTFLDLNYTLNGMTPTLSGDVPVQFQGFDESYLSEGVMAGLNKINGKQWGRFGFVNIDINFYQRYGFPLTNTPLLVSLADFGRSRLSARAEAIGGVSRFIEINTQRRIIGMFGSTHEVGHVLGLAHQSNDVRSMMNYANDGYSGAKPSAHDAYRLVMAYAK